MSEFNDQNEITEETQESLPDEEFSTVFSAPQHAEKKQGNVKRKRLIAVIAAVLAVAVLSTGIWAAVKFIPTLEEKNGDTNSNTPSDISVIEIDKANVGKITVNNKNGSFTLHTKDVETKDSEGKATTEKIWLVNDLEEKYTSSDSISVIASAATSITAMREIDKKSAEECGFESPSVTADVDLKDGEDYSVLIGGDSPDGTGIYLKLSNSDKIYLVNSSVAESFDFELLDLADNSAFPAAEFKEDVIDDNGQITSLDYIRLSGANFPDAVKIEPNNDENMSSVVSYIITEPQNRYADNIDTVLSLFTSGVTVDGAYSFDVSPKSLKAVGLDNPDVIVTLCAKGESKTYKIKAVDGEYCAVINDDSYMIKKVSLSSLALATYKAENMYSSWICMDAIADMDNYTVITGGKTYSFDIKQNGDDADEKFTVTYNGKQTNLENFQQFYMYFVGMNCSNYTVDKISASPDATVKLKMKNGTVKTITYTPFNDTKHQVSVNGKVIGKISSTYYNKYIKYLNMVVAGEKINA